MSNGMVRVFVNASGLDVASGSTALDAVRVWSPEAADEVATGSRVITDSRGLPMDSSAIVVSGSILRLILRRERDSAEPIDS